MTPHQRFPQPHDRVERDPPGTRTMEALSALRKESSGAPVTPLAGAPPFFGPSFFVVWVSPGLNGVYTEKRITSTSPGVT